MELNVRVQGRDGATFVELEGHLGTADYRNLRDRLLKEAAEEPRAVIVDVDRVSAENIPLTVFSYVADRMAEWPGIPLLLVAETPEANKAWRSAPLGRFVNIYASRQAALDAADSIPERVNAVLWLANNPVSSARARRFCSKTCAGWGIDHVSEDVIAIAVELVENTLQHTASDGALRLKKRDHRLTVSMTDDDLRPAVLREAGHRNRSSNGLRIVAQLSKAWGCTYRPGGGKVVWAIVPLDRPF
jgi:hypothetical protein